MLAPVLDRKQDIKMRKYSRLLCTTTGRGKRVRVCARTHTHTHTHTNHCLDDWFYGFIGDSQSDQAGRKEGTPTYFQERRHLLQLNQFNKLIRVLKLENTDYSLLLDLLVKKYKY